MNPSELTEDELQEYQNEFEDLSEKTILVSILFELQHIRFILQGGSERASGSESDSSDLWYECTFCLESVREDEREKHLRREHDSPGGVELGEVYEKV